jgi:hypothetical protein
LHEDIDYISETEQEIIDLDNKKKEQRINQERDRAAQKYLSLLTSQLVNPITEDNVQVIVNNLDNQNGVLNGVNPANPPNGAVNAVEAPEDDLFESNMFQNGDNQGINPAEADSEVDFDFGSSANEEIDNAQPAPIPPENFDTNIMNPPQNSFVNSAL